MPFSRIVEEPLLCLTEIFIGLGSVPRLKIGERYNPLSAFKGIHSLE